MFETDPHPSEYQLYLVAKARREAAEAEKAAKKAKAAAEAKEAAKTGGELALRSFTQQCQPVPDHHIRSGSQDPACRCSWTQRG